MNKAQEIKNIKEAKKNGEVYISPMVVSPNRIQELFIQALGEVLNEDKNNINLTNERD